MKMPFTKLCVLSLGTFVPIQSENSQIGEDKCSYPSRPSISIDADQTFATLKGFGLLD